MLTERYTNVVVAPRTESAPVSSEGESHHGLMSAIGHAALFTKTGRRIVAGALVAAAGVGYWSSDQDSVPAHNSCMAGDAKYTHDYVMIGNTSNFLGLPGLSKESLRSMYNRATFGSAATDNRTWGDLATLETERRGYTITAAQLANANQSLSKFHNGKAEAIDYRGPACIALPAPGVWGVRTTDGKQSVKDYTGDAIDSVAQIVKLNPGLAVLDQDGKLDAAKTLEQVLPAGFTIRTKEKIDFSLFTQPMTQSFYDVYKDDTALGQKIRLENDASTGLKSGTQANLPPKQTRFMKDHDMTVAGEQQAYAHSYDSKNLGEAQLALPPSTDTKPVTPEKTSQNTQNATDVLMMQQMANTLISWPSEHYPNKTYLSYYIEYAKKYHLDEFGITAVDLFSQGIQESGVTNDPSKVTSSAGAMGIAQFMPATWKEQVAELGFPSDASPWNPRYAIEAQAHKMRSLCIRVKPYAHHASDIKKLALAGYNLGEGAVEQYKGMPPKSLIGDYVTNIVGHSGNIKSKFGKLHLTDKKHRTTTNELIADHVGNIVYFSQTDGAWNQYQYRASDGAHNTLGWVGCWPATAAMILSTKLGIRITPVDMANYAMSHGFAVDHGGVETNGEAAFKAIGKDYGFQVTTFDKSQLSDMLDFVRSGGFIGIAGTDKSGSGNTPYTSEGHVIFIRGVTAGGKLLIGDPKGDGYASTQKAWEPSQIVGKASYFVGLKLHGSTPHVSLALP